MLIVCAGWLQRAELEAKANERLRELEQLAYKHKRELEDVADNHAQAVREIQYENEDEEAELHRENADIKREYQDQVMRLESHVVQLKRELEGLQTQKANMLQLKAAHVSLHAWMIANAVCQLWACSSCICIASFRKDCTFVQGMMVCIFVNH